ncbi:MAG TPA: STAS domain-containing protein [Solirubrobacteraceae bacterium]|jgi:anti-sigma B factor antagonist|nr:STAS domain-containing protein [Solirubrobacteraceae bacterium]
MSEEQALDLRVEQPPGGFSATLDLAGELDISTADRLKQAIGELLVEHGARELTVDLRQLTFIDSSGLAAMVYTSRQCEQHQCRLSVVRGSQSVHSVFELTRLHELLPFADGDGDNGDAPS